MSDQREDKRHCQKHNVPMTMVVEDRSGPEWWCSECAKEAAREVRREKVIEEFDKIVAASKIGESVTMSRQLAIWALRSLRALPSAIAAPDLRVAAQALADAVGAFDNQGMPIKHLRTARENLLTALAAPSHEQEPTPLDGEKCSRIYEEAKASARGENPVEADYRIHQAALVNVYAAGQRSVFRAKPSSVGERTPALTKCDLCGSALWSSCTKAGCPKRAQLRQDEQVTYAIEGSISILRDLARRVPDVLKVADIEAFVLNELNPALAIVRNATPSAIERTCPYCGGCEEEGCSPHCVTNRVGLRQLLVEVRDTIALLADPQAKAKHPNTGIAQKLEDAISALPATDRTVQS